MLDHWRRLWDCRYFWWSLAKNDLRARYRRSVIGIGWSLLRPITFTILLCLVLRRIFHRADWDSYAPELLAGLVCWDYVSAAIRGGCTCFFHAEAYIRQHPAPLTIYPLRITLGETIHFLLALSVVLVFCWVRHGPGNLAALLTLPLTLMLFFLFAWSVALLMGVANVFYRDVQHLCDIGLQFLFYATPVIYRLEDLGEGRFRWLIQHGNPLVPFFQLLRQTILAGQPPQLPVLAAACAIVLVFGSSALFLAVRMQRQLIFHL